MLSLETPPQAEVMSAADATLRAQLRLDDNETDEDAMVQAHIITARSHVERYARIGLLPQVWRLTLPCFPAASIDLPRGPVRTVDAVRYTQADGSLAALDSASYRIMRTGSLASVAPAFGVSWPASAGGGHIEIDFAVGYDTAADVPAPILQAIRLLVAHYHLNREAVGKAGEEALPFGVKDLLAPYRLYS